MIELFFKQKGKRKYEQVPNGPWPYDKHIIEQLRADMQEQIKLDDALQGGQVTLVRALLQQYYPNISDFDCLCIGNYLVCAGNLKVLETG